jgi:hypothetical protein
MVTTAQYTDLSYAVRDSADRVDVGHFSAIECPRSCGFSATRPFAAGRISLKIIAPGLALSFRNAMFPSWCRLSPLFYQGGQIYIFPAPMNHLGGGALARLGFDRLGRVPADPRRAATAGWLPLRTEMARGFRVRGGGVDRRRLSCRCVVYTRTFRDLHAWDAPRGMKLFIDPICERCCCLFASAGLPSYANGRLRRNLREIFASTLVWICFCRPVPWKKKMRKKGSVTTGVFFR